MRRVIVTRPAEQFADLAAALADLGIAAIAAPMLAVEPTRPGVPIPPDCRALLVTSINGVAGAVRLGVGRNLPVLAVGEATGDAARDAGFETVTAGGGDGAALVALVAGEPLAAGGPLLWVRGEAVSTDIAAQLATRGVAVEQRVAYRTVMADALPEDAVEALQAGAVEGVLFFSPRSAEAFARLVAACGLVAPCAKMAAHCMSRAIARAASILPWRTIHVAKAPTRQALLDTLTGSDPADEHR